MVTFVGVLAVLVVVTIVLIVLANVTGAPGWVTAEREQLAHERAEARLLPVGTVRLSGEPMPEIAGAQPSATPAAAADLSPSEVYQASCTSCHAAGVMGAPRSGNEGDWAPRLQEKGFDTLVQNAITGIGGMPPRGGNARLTDEQIRDTTRFMLEESGLSVD